MTVFSPNMDDEILCRIACLGGPFKNREFAWECKGSDDQIYMQRSRRFDSIVDLHREVEGRGDIVTLHIGPLMNGDKRLTKRELIFDLDVTDKEQYCACSCALTKSACEKCWLFIRLSMHCINYFLENSLCVPRASIHWFFSGNRGVHCFVSDPRFAYSDPDMRTQICNYLTYDATKPLTSEQLLLAPVIDRFFADKIQPTHGSKWPSLDIADRAQIMEMCWPKIDRQVTASHVHLLRCPFTIHRKTKRHSQLITAPNLLDYVPDCFMQE